MAWENENEIIDLDSIQDENIDTQSPDESDTHLNVMSDKDRGVEDPDPSFYDDYNDDDEEEQPLQKPAKLQWSNDFDGVEMPDVPELYSNDMDETSSTEIEEVEGQLSKLDVSDIVAVKQWADNLNPLEVMIDSWARANGVNQDGTSLEHLRRMFAEEHLGIDAEDLDNYITFGDDWVDEMPEGFQEELDAAREQIDQIKGKIGEFTSKEGTAKLSEAVVYREQMDHIHELEREWNDIVSHDQGIQSQLKSKTIEAGGMRLSNKAAKLAEELIRDPKVLASKIRRGGEVDVKTMSLVARLLNDGADAFINDMRAVTSKSKTQTTKSKTTTQKPKPLPTKISQRLKGSKWESIH